MSDQKLVISQGKRPLWKTILTAVFFTIAFFEIWSSLILLFNYRITEDNLRYVASSLGPIAYCTAFGITTGLRKTISIDIQKQVLISTYFIGPFSKDIIAPIPKLQYVSVFKDGKDLCQVNLWYNGNKRYNMFTFEEPESALNFAKTVCLKLNLDLLDATKPNNSKWIELVEA